MATITKARSRVAYTISGNSPEIKNLPEGAGQTYKAGAVCYPSASGRMLAKTNNNSTISVGNPSKGDFGGRGIYGIATKDAGNYTNSTTSVPFIIVNDDVVFLTNVVNRLTAASGTIGYAMIGTVCGGSFHNSGMFIMRTTLAATNSIAVCRGLFEDDSAGDLNGRVYFQFTKAIRAMK